jgi:hypothetical protein
MRPTPSAGGGHAHPRAIESQLASKLCHVAGRIRPVVTDSNLPPPTTTASAAAEGIGTPSILA